MTTPPITPRRQVTTPIISSLSNQNTPDNSPKLINNNKTTNGFNFNNNNNNKNVNSSSFSLNNNIVRSTTANVNTLSLLKLAPTVINSRSGSVLTRGTILKSEYTTRLSSSTSSSSSSSNESPKIISNGLHLRGAPNFRMAGETESIDDTSTSGTSSSLNIYGCGQPSETGLRTVLSVLGSRRSHPNSTSKETVWICTREIPIIYLGVQPFVLRDSINPTKSYALSDRAENLEAIEIRLKEDIIREGTRYGGLILVQEEIGNGEIINTWVAVDSVRTVREVWEQVTKEGYNLKYFRLPIAKDQSPDDDTYLDTYTSILATIPTSSALVFNCGLGVVRTTFAMSTATLIRRRQLMLEGKGDCFGMSLSLDSSGGGVGQEGKNSEEERAKIILFERKEQSRRDQSLLRLMNVLQKSLANSSQVTLISLLSSRPRLLENLRTALLGQYELILSLLSCLDDGNEQKNLVDAVIDNCDALINIRESVLHHRVRYASLALIDKESSLEQRSKAFASLERYFFLVAFASFVSSSSASFPVKFSTWLQQRPEISNMISRMRKSAHFYVFSPVHDLSAISKGDAGELSASNEVARSRFADAKRNGGEVLGDELAGQIVRNRNGVVLRACMILKQDQWTASAEGQESTIRGAINFRRVPNSSLYALSQPSQDGIDRVLETVRNDMKDVDGQMTWINLREEPLIYVNGTPYVLRLESVSLRNVKSYVGISSTRLELLEDRLKSDVLAEALAFNGRILLHSEADDGTVNTVWEVIKDDSCVQTLREIMDAARLKFGTSFSYKRIPITAERSPDFADVRSIVELVAQLDVEKCAIIVNCQLGRGRSTRTQVIITLVQQWIRSGGHRLPTSGPDSPRSTRYSYTVINNLLRVIRSGQEIKSAVDAAITACGETYDLLDSIEDARQCAEDAEDDLVLKQQRVERGVQNLKAYYFLILFASFLNESKAETWRDLRETATYEQFVKERPVFKTIESELDTATIEALIPLERPLVTGNALSDEVADFVSKRSGRILSQYTLLKSDYFSGLQKMSLPERIEGVPNFRRVRIPFTDTPSTPLTANSSGSLQVVYGTGMPTVSGLRTGLERMGALKNLVVYTSMREEPVCYVTNGRPHVLRLFDAPLENVITTGVTSETVENMEAALKQDLLLEASLNGGKVLLHDEIEEADGSFTVTATWEEVTPADILTPKEVFELMKAEGYKVDYRRLPVTDEQAPIPQTYSMIESRVHTALKHNAALAFNCQMGRGRTTTGMIAAALVSNILYGSTSDLSSSIIDLDPRENLTWDGRESEPYLNGEYKVVLQLVGVLSHGKFAKRLTDRAVDIMEGVQNLRKAVYDFKLRAEAADVGSNKHKKINEQASQYLYRYATLIIFANYLLEKSEDTAQKEEDLESGDLVEEAAVVGLVSFPPFKQWLDARREISQILSRRTLD